MDERVRLCRSIEGNTQIRVDRLPGLWSNSGRPNTPNHIRNIGRNFLAGFQYESEAA